jgi:hypothetical protein
VGDVVFGRHAHGGRTLGRRGGEGRCHRAAAVAARGAAGLLAVRVSRAARGAAHDETARERSVEVAEGAMQAPQLGVGLEPMDNQRQYKLKGDKMVRH